MVNPIAQITKEQADALLEAGHVTKKDYEKWEKNGAIKHPKRAARLTQMKTPEDKVVNPTLVFRGGRGTTDSKAMQEMRVKFSKHALEFDETESINKSIHGSK